MELQNKYNVYLDFHGYMIEPASYRVSPAPLLGSKFSTGRLSYSEMDFWQVGGITDFSHGINQKFMVDPSRLFTSVGLDLSKPGELKLEKDLAAFTMPATIGNVTAHHRTLNRLYIGDDNGKIWSGAGSSFRFEKDTGEAKIYSFYETGKKLFACTGSGKTFVNLSPDTSTDWVSISEAIKIDGLYRSNENWTPTTYKNLYSTFTVCQQIKPAMSSESFYTLKVYLKKNGSPTSNLVFTIYPESTVTPGYPDLDATPIATYTIAPASVNSTAAYHEYIPDGNAQYSLVSKVTYFIVASTGGGDSSNSYYWYYANGPRAQYAYGGELETDLVECKTATAISGGYSSEDIASAADINIQVAQSFVPVVTSDKYYSVSMFAGKTLSPTSNLIATIETDNSNKPSGTVLMTFTLDSSLMDNNFRWIEKKAAAVFQLLSDTKYWLRLKCTVAPVTGNFFNLAKNTSAPYSEGTGATTVNGGTNWSIESFDFAFKIKTNPEWKANEYQNMLLTLKSNTIDNLYFVHNESETLFGWFDDGVRQSTDGFNWIPEPPDPLWVMPSGEGVTLNAVTIPRGFLSGSKRGLWMFGGGGSGWNIWKFPDYTSADNFAGMDNWSYFGIFSIENQGIYFTEGSNVYPSNITWLDEGFTFKSCKSIYSSGNDIYAVVSNNGSTWYLARCNTSWTPKPVYWWIVKQLTKTPVHIAGWNDSKIFVFYSDNTAEYFDKNSDYYVSSGYCETPWIDEGVVKLQKLYRNLSVIYDSLPSGTSTTLGYKLNSSEEYTTSSSFTSGNESVFDLENPTLGNKLRIKLVLNGKSNDKTVTPIATDLTWKYILQAPSEDTTTKKSYSFLVVAESWLEQNTGEIHELDRLTPRTRQDILNDLWTTSAKKQILNFIGADNKSEVGLEIEYTGSGASCVCTVDRTNYTISSSVDGSAGFSYNYENKTITEVATYINELADYTCTVHVDQTSTRTAHDIEPRNDLQIKGKAYLMVGSDVKSVIMINSPSQTKRAIEGEGSDRMSISLRDA